MGNNGEGNHQQSNPHTNTTLQPMYVQVYSTPPQVSANYFERHQVDTKCKEKRKISMALALYLCPMMVKIIDRNM
jgi:hypothetical protein